MVRMTIGRRLTLWYGLLWTLSLVALGVALYSTFAHNLLAEIDRALDESPRDRRPTCATRLAEHPFAHRASPRPAGTRRR